MLAIRPIRSMKISLARTFYRRAWLCVSHAHSVRHPGESRDPLNTCSTGGTASAETIHWIPAFAGMTGGGGPCAAFASDDFQGCRAFGSEGDGARKTPPPGA